MKFNTKRVISGFLAALTIATSAIQPLPVLAADNGSEKPPSYESVKDLLDADEVVTAKDLEIEMGASFDIEKDFSNIEIPDSKKVKVTFEEAMNDQNESFVTDHEDTYKAVYYVEPQTTDHPTYQINRKIIVKDTRDKSVSSTEVSQSETQTENQSDSGGGGEESAEDGEADSENQAAVDKETEVSTEDTESENLTDKEFDELIEAAETQDTVDDESGLSLSDVLLQAGEVLKGFGEDFEYEKESLKGAQFNVYASEDIYTLDHQKAEDGKRNVIYAKDALVATVTTDEDGKAVIENLPLGKYRVEEVKAPYGFTLNTSVKEVNFVYAGQDVPVVKETVSFTDERQKVSLRVEKQDAETGNVVGGAVFGVYNAESIVVDGKVIVKADTLLQKMTSDENGQAVCTLNLPLSKYYVKELEAPASFVSSDEVLDFDASYQGQDVKVITLKSIKKNKPTTVSVTKSDITTGVELDGAYLTVLDKDNNVIDQWTSVKDEPHVIKYLVAGETYTLRETFAPYGYLKATDITFTVSDTAEVQPVEMKDEVPTGLLIINKKGEFLDSVTLVSKIKGIVEHIFNYITGNLTEVTFDVFAEEDIKAADGVSEDYYKAGDKVATIVTDENGIASLENLPLGKYYVKEVKTAHGYVLDEEIRHIDLTYRDQDTPVVTFNEEWQNHRQRVEVSVLKKEKGSDRVLEGGVFGLFAAEDIVSSSGEVLIEKDEIIELKTTDAEGKIDFIADLPQDAKYYVKEMYAPDGFVNSEEVQEFTVEYAGDSEKAIQFAFTFEDEPTTVEITKTALTTGKKFLDVN